MKTTIPEAIVEYLQLRDKDTLEWQMGMKDNEQVALMKRKENTSEQPQNFDEDLTLISRHRTRNSQPGGAPK